MLIYQDEDEVYKETIWVSDLGSGRYKVDNCPFFFYGIAYKDIIEAIYSEEEERLVFTKLLEKSGNKLLRVIFDNPAKQKGREQKFLEELVNMGCSYEGANPKYYCINIPKGIELFEVCDYLTKNSIQWEHVAPTYSELYPDEENS